MPGWAGPGRAGLGPRGQTELEAGRHAHAGSLMQFGRAAPRQLEQRKRQTETLMQKKRIDDNGDREVRKSSNLADAIAHSFIRTYFFKAT